MNLALPLLSIALLGLLPGAAPAHETRPAYLEIEQLEGHQYRFSFRQPQLAGRFLGLGVTSDCTPVGEPRQTIGSSALEHSWVADCGEAPVTRARLRVQGLERSLVDTLVLIRTRDGEESSHVLTPNAPMLQESGGGLSFVPAYFILGVEHLVFGIDHVAFLLALIYLLKDARRLVLAVTSFTLAHSITLGVSALGWLTLAQKPVEALIALSILLVAHDIASGREDSPLKRHPWALTFVFGLLHGFGFAGALAETGLPEGGALMALLLFNLGIEAGQLAIIAAVLAGVWLLGQLQPADRLQLAQRWRRPVASLAYQAPVYAIGSLGGYWFIDRSLGILLGG